MESKDTKTDPMDKVLGEKEGEKGDVWKVFLRNLISANRTWSDLWLRGTQTGALAG